MAAMLRPDVFTIVALMIAALPWYAVFSGTYGLYFCVLVLMHEAARLALGGFAGEAVSAATFIVLICASVGSPARAEIDPVWIGRCLSRRKDQ